MVFKELEIQGFKSFPDKVKIRFDAGVTGVVGPNGSGKSNLSDAVRWVLGETSSRQLRAAGKMEDVIFGGTRRRSAMGFASVRLTLDNTGHTLDVDADEVTIGRKYYRSGDSEYTINGQVCRLRGLLNDLFDPVDRRITVTEEVSNVGDIVLHRREVQRAVRLPARGSGRMVVLNRRGYGGVSGYDFWVNIPVALLDEIDTDRVRAVVDSYKLASKRYQINFV